MDETKLLHIILLTLFCHVTAAGRFSFPDGSSSSRSSTARSDSDRDRPSAGSRQREFEGRSIRGGSSGKPDYSRYSVYEHQDDDYRPSYVRSTTTTTARPTARPPYYGSTTRHTSYYTPSPNAFYNRLPPSKNDEPIEAEPEDDYSDEDVVEAPDPPTTSRPSSSAADYSSSSYGTNPVTFNNLFYGFHNDKFGGLGNLFGEDRRKHKYKFKRRRPGQPCIPYDLFNKLKYGRDANGNRIDPKTLIPPLSLVLADVNYYSPSNNYNGHGGHGSYDSTAADTGSSNGGGGAIFNNHFYDAVGGYPCTGTNFGGGNRPLRPHGGPLGFFGQGGLFDWTTSADSVQSDTGEGGSSNRPTVVFNLNDAIDSVATNWKPGESFQMMMKVIAEFITSVAGAGAAPVADGVGLVEDAVDTVRKVNKEFTSLFTG